MSAIVYKICKRAFRRLAHDSNKVACVKIHNLDDFGNVSGLLLSLKLSYYGAIFTKICSDHIFTWVVIILPFLIIIILKIRASFFNYNVNPHFIPYYHSISMYVIVMPISYLEEYPVIPMNILINMNIHYVDPILTP